VEKVAAGTSWCVSACVTRVLYVSVCTCNTPQSTECQYPMTPGACMTTASELAMLCTACMYAGHSITKLNAARTPGSCQIVIVEAYKTPHKTDQAGHYIHDTSIIRQCRFDTNKLHGRSAEAAAQYCSAMQCQCQPQ
jgi:hypothetical protein